MNKPTTILRNAANRFIMMSALAFFLLLSGAKGQSIVVIDAGSAGTPAHNSAPIYRSFATSAYDASRYCYLYTQSELAAAGITAGSGLSVVGWTKSNSAITLGPAIFRIYMKNSSATDFSLASTPWTTPNSGATLVYENLAQDIPSDSFPTYITFPLNAAFVYTGGSLEISTEWDINSVSGDASTGTFSWLWSTVADRIYGTGQTSLANAGTLSSTSNSISDLNDRRPFIQINFGPVGIHDIDTMSRVVVFPNPSSGKMKIAFTKASREDLQIRLVNAIGQKVFSEEVINFSGDYEREISTNHFAKGMYYLHVFTEKSFATEKVVIQ